MFRLFTSVSSSAYSLGVQSTGQPRRKNLAAVEVDFHFVQLKRGAAFRVRRSTASTRASSSSISKRFGDIVVGPHGEAAHPVGQAAFGREKKWWGTCCACW